MAERDCGHAQVMSNGPILLESLPYSTILSLGHEVPTLPIIRTQHLFC